MLAGGVSPVAGDAQMDLFAPFVELARDLDAALAGGRFEEAARCRLLMEETFGPSPETESRGFLGRLCGVVWQSSPGAALRAWEEIDAQLRNRAHLRALVRNGVFARLLEVHPPETLVEAEPACLPALAGILGRRPDAADGRRRARALVRDACLAGRDLQALDFAYDEPLCDLLAEDLPPRWLACLGAVRRLWPVARSRPAAWLDPLDSLEPLDPLPGSRSDDEAALEFWRCLQVSEDPASSNELVREARRRMKRLSPDLHARYMRRATVRPGVPAAAARSSASVMPFDSADVLQT